MVLCLFHVRTPSYIYNLANNKFNGEISVEIGERLSTVSLVWLSGNELKGSIPSSICSRELGLYSNIQYLDLSNNKLSGIIPTSIRFCDSLIYLNLATNNFTGNVPKELEQANKLQILQLNDNNFDGTPLHFIGKLHELVVLNLANNNFGGSISTLSAASLNNLQILSLRSNNFTESIPEDLFDLHLLHLLDLSGNNLTGLIPKKIGNLTMLRSRPSKNRRIKIMLRSRSSYTFSLFRDGGGYPSHLEFQMTSKGIMMQYENLHTYNSGIDLSSNIFEGEIPKEICLLKELSMLNLSHNRLSGNIPLNVGSITNLESLDLSFNKLSGPIPVSSTSLDFLGYLNLSYNNLSGRIPRGLHFDTLSEDGSAYVGNSFLCGFPIKNICESNQSSDTSDSNSLDENGQNDTRDKWYFYGILALGFIVGFWGLFFGLLMNKETWWFGYWRAVDIVVVKIVQFFAKD
ncbi:receptor like protein 23-like [Papaver somniferum]|uniref:receptor like protein 23-like n=1 Tax=Papaver somniferum TaxID=3469 RepID=UPI000E70514A|nr:receptor like protein 23-like [Papaver somniferum]